MEIKKHKVHQKQPKRLCACKANGVNLPIKAQ